VVESLRTRGLNQQLRLSYYASVQEYYEFYIALLVQLEKLEPLKGYAAKAVFACERAQARGLLDLVAEAKVDLRQGVDPALLQQELLVSEKLNAAAAKQRKLLSSSHVKQQVADATRELDDLNIQFESIEAHIRTANPGYAAIVQPQPLSAAQIQTELLDQNTLLLQYALGAEQSYLLAVSPDKITTYELPARHEIERLAGRFYETATFRNHPTAGSIEARRAAVVQADIEADKLANQLSQVLLAPAAGRLGYKHLIVVAPGALQLVPFAALPEPQQPTVSMQVSGHVSQGPTGKAREPLVLAHEVVVLPSMTTLSMMRLEMRNRQRPPKQVAVLADPVFSANDPRIDVVQARPLTNNISTSGENGSKNGAGAAESAKESEFPRLVSSRWEGEKILALVPPSDGRLLLLDFAASRAMASNPELGRYRFVHFATHAVIDDQRPELSGIVLSMVDEKGRARNGFLSLHEIFNLKLPVDLVVLSACRTALGKHYEGEGFVGLTRGFIYAGASRVVVSLWQVADKPTSELMVRFYRNILGPRKLSPAAALSAAQVELWRDPRWRAPYFWGGFVLHGEWR
jgi:CHAT domain-containing protein